MKVWYSRGMRRILAFIFAILVGGGAFTLTAPVSVGAAGSCEKSFLGFQAWYNGLAMDSNCNITPPENSDELPVFMLRIILNIVIDVFTLAGYLALGFIIYGGYLYIIAEGDPGKVAKGKKTIIAAIIGLVITISANVIMNFIATLFTGGGK